jgi:hypothetical protein
MQMESSQRFEGTWFYHSDRVFPTFRMYMLLSCKWSLSNVSKVHTSIIQMESSQRFECTCFYASIIQMESSQHFEGACFYHSDRVFPTFPKHMLLSCWRRKKHLRNVGNVVPIHSEQRSRIRIDAVCSSDKPDALMLQDRWKAYLMSHVSGLHAVKPVSK